MSWVADRTKLSQSGVDFIDEDYLHGLLNRKTDAAEVGDVIAKSMAKEPLAIEETAVLIAAAEPELTEQIFDAARQLKRDVYGNRIVLFAPLYVGNDCTNDCQYCAFRRSNKEQIRRTLSEADLRQQVEALLRRDTLSDPGVWRHRYSPEYVAGRRSIRRVGPGTSAA